jgi:hypothetical protein
VCDRGNGGELKGGGTETDGTTQGGKRSGFEEGKGEVDLEVVMIDITRMMRLLYRRF